ncbi:MAG: glycoside hydrolase family 32 protein [Puia sp.]|nr:glycoside hydrolase family 32 protein [Puia sp.]
MNRDIQNQGWVCFQKSLVYCALLFSAQVLHPDASRAQKKAVDPPGRKILLESRYLHFPVKKGASKEHLRLSVAGVKVREIEIELATGTPDYWVYTDVSEWIGKTVVMGFDKAPTAPSGAGPSGSSASSGSGVSPASAVSSGSAAFADVFQSNTEDGADRFYNEKVRPQFHFTSRRGWLNDPNGLVFYKGEWHMFYQHNPFGTGWGNMTWGHAISADLVHWREMDDAIQPDKLGTVFSGSANVDVANTTGFKRGDESPLVAMYTAAGGTSDWSASQPFTQCLAYSNDKGRHWIKYEKNPVLPNVKEGNRDPKIVWYEPGHEWIVAFYLDGNTYALFSSPDLKNWKELQRINMEGSGECPDFFEIALDGNPADKRWVLTGANDHYLVGSFDGKTFTPEQAPRRGDWGDNYYAVQSYSGVPGSDGRRIQIGWMNGSELPGMPFSQQMAFPRELSLRSTAEGPCLFSVPAREIGLLHAAAHRWDPVLLKGGDAAGNPRLSLQGELFHIKAEFDTAAGRPVAGDGAPAGLARDFGIRVRGFSLLYNTSSKMLCIVRGHDTTARYIGLPAFGTTLKWEILVDRGSIEIFVNDGAVPMAFAYIPDEDDKTIRLIAHDGDVMLKSLEIFDLKPAWETRTDAT